MTTIITTMPGKTDTLRRSQRTRTPTKFLTQTSVRMSNRTRTPIVRLSPVAFASKSYD